MSDLLPSSASATTPQTDEKGVNIAPPVLSKQPTPKALYRLARGALITAVVSIAFHPFSIWIGYQISQALKAPRASIENVVPTIYREKLVFDATLLRRLKANSRLMGPLRASLERLTAGKESSCDDWLSDGEWETRCQADISRAADSLWSFLDSDAQTVKRDIELLKVAPPTEPPPMLEMTADPDLQQVSTLLTLGRVSIPAAIGRLKKIDSANDVLHKDLDDLRAGLADSERSRCRFPAIQTSRWES